MNMQSQIDLCRQEQIKAADWIAEHGWDELGAVLGMADHFAEEFILQQEADS